jgi:hypothetical protein
MHWGNLNILKKKLQKISFKNSFACKSYFWEKGLVILFQVILLAPSYRFDLANVVIIRLTDFGNVKSVGHMNTINIGSAEVTIQLKAIERVDQYFAMEHPIDVQLMHAPKNVQLSSDELHGPQDPQHNINNTLYITLTNDGDAGLFRILHLLGHLNQGLKGNIRIGP